MRGAQSVLRSTNTSAETTASLADSSIHDRLDKSSPLVDQTHIKFADVSYCRSIKFLLQYTADAIVDWVQNWLIWRPQCLRNEVWHLSLQDSDGVSCSMCQCTVLLKDKTPPWEIRNMSGCGLIVFTGSIKWILVIIYSYGRPACMASDLAI